MSYKDHFSGHASLYARYRPRYPAALFRYLALVSPEQERAWDCATGNGQAALGLAAQFRRIIATDPSPQQIENAEPHDRIEYRVAPAERSGLESASVSLITVAQALHWFDIPAFFAEAQRVLKPHGIIGVWAYTLTTISPEIDAVVHRYYYETTAPFWPPERALVETRYREIAFPFAELEAPAFAIEEHWTLEQLLGYLRSWSATQKFMQANGYDPLEMLGEEICRHWRNAGRRRLIRWPLALRVGKIGC